MTPLEVLGAVIVWLTVQLAVLGFLLITDPLRILR